MSNNNDNERFYEYFEDDDKQLQKATMHLRWGVLAILIFVIMLIIVFLTIIIAINIA